MSRPPMTMLPLSASSKPAMQLSKVDLPTPDSPSSATNSPAASVRLTSLNTGVAP